jgi:hypothetical protein
LIQAYFGKIEHAYVILRTSKCNKKALFFLR